MDNEMIDRISEIEAAAAAIMDEANNRKKEYAQKMDEKTTAFDASLEADTEKKIDDLRSQMETSMNEQLKKQQTDAEKTIEDLENNYNLHHKKYVEKLFSDLIKE